MAKTRTEKRDTGSKGREKSVAQAAGKAPVATEAGESTAPARTRVSPLKFLQQVRQEVSKVTWPTRKETTVTTIMVWVMVILSALFFFTVDEVLGRAVSFILNRAA